MTYRTFACAATAVATLLLCALCLTAQVPQQHIKVVKQRRDSVRTVHDTVWRLRVDTVIVPRFAFDSFFVHDTVRDTVSRHALLPLSLPFDWDRDCPKAPPPAQTTTPEPATVLLVGSGLAALWLKRRKR